MIRIFLLFIISLGAFTVMAQDVYHQTLKLMGSRFDISVVAKDSTEGNSYIAIAAGEITRI